ncbi:hypothetical protein M3J09_013223 [Ascochyta lentis]
MHGMEARSPLHRFTFAMCCSLGTSPLVYAPMLSTVVSLVQPVWSSLQCTTSWTLTAA